MCDCTLYWCLGAEIWKSSEVEYKDEVRSSKDGGWDGEDGVEASTNQ